METVTTKVNAFYTPAALINLINNALNIHEAKRLISLRGVYIPGKGQNYNGFYYDTLKDEVSDYQISLVTPGLIRSQLVPDKVIEFNGYINRKTNSRGFIEIQINMNQLLSQTHTQFTEEDIKSLEVQQLKSTLGYRDVEALLKAKIVKGQRIKVVVIVGRTNIIHEDIKGQMKEAIGFYDLHFHQVNLSNSTNIENAVRKLNTSEVDVLCVSRGGGDNLEVFNKPMLAEVCLNLKPLFVTAIGHKQDITLLQKMADKAFITPTAFGQFLNEIFNNTKAELENSRAQLVDDVTKQLKTQYEKQVANLTQQIATLKELNERSKQETELNYQQRIGILEKQLKEVSAGYDENKKQFEFLSARELEATLTQLTQQERLTNEANELAKNYFRQYEQAHKNQGVPVTTLVVIAVCSIIVGLLLGALLRGWD